MTTKTAKSKRPASCRDCGAKAVDGARISRRGHCYDCGQRLANDSITQIMAGQGPIADRWRAGMAHPRRPTGRPRKHPPPEAPQAENG